VGWVGQVDLRQQALQRPQQVDDPSAPHLHPLQEDQADQELWRTHRQYFSFIFIFYFFYYSLLLFIIHYYLLLLGLSFFKYYSIIC
jgi:hypothetical protein